MTGQVIGLEMVFGVILATGVGGGIAVDGSTRDHGRVEPQRWFSAPAQPGLSRYSALSRAEGFHWSNRRRSASSLIALLAPVRVGRYDADYRARRSRLPR